MDISLQILLLIAVLIVLAKAVGSLSARVGMPLVLGELLAGVILGPTALDIWKFPWFASPASTDGHALSLAAVLKVLADLGVVVLMFLAGLETDTKMMKAAMGPAFWSASGGVILPMVAGCAVSRLAGFGWGEAIFIGTILTATSVSITAQTLMNLGRLRTRPGSTILGAAVIDDVLGLMALSVVIAMEPKTAYSAGAGWSSSVLMPIGRMVLFLGLAFWLGPKVIRALFKNPKRFQGPHTGVAAALAVGFLGAFLAESLGGMAAITGAYLAGLFISTSPTHAEVVGDLRSMTNSFFGPIFFVSIGLEMNARNIGHHLEFLTAIVSVAILTKVLGCFLGAVLNGLTPRESLTVGVGMIPRGEVGLITANIGWAAGIVSGGTYSLVVIVVLVTTLVTPGALQMLFSGQPHAPQVLPSVVAAEIEPNS